jgi:hypothetical protein
MRSKPLGLLQPQQLPVPMQHKMQLHIPLPKILQLPFLRLPMFLHRTFQTLRAFDLEIL